MMRQRIEIQRVYRPAPRGRQAAFLVDRLWPRGVSKRDLARSVWLKNVGPSDRLRHWFGHDPAKWPEFKKRYFLELKANPSTWRPLAEAARKGPVALLFATKDADHSNAAALREFLVGQLRKKSAA